MFRPGDTCQAGNRAKNCCSIPSTRCVSMASNRILSCENRRIKAPLPRVPDRSKTAGLLNGRKEDK